ncbi:sensor histidine kinase [Mucilaginibacter mallensis]|nr:HAMP domain-containing sensor histidine kinase [Mucilaginibacter mallensis]
MFAVLMLMVLTGIYFFAAHNRVNTFFEKLDDRATTVAQFYLAQDNLSNENFKDVLRKFPQSLSGETIRIYNDHFQSQFIPGGAVHWDVSILKQVVNQRKVQFFQDDRQVTGIYYKDNSGNFIIMVAAIDDSGYHYLNDLRLIMLFFFLAALVITYVMGSVFSKVALLPIVKITRNLKRIRSSSLDLRLPIAPKKTDEIDTLSVTINQLLEHLEQSFESQRSFIAHASHELRTPITTILGEAETTLVMDRPQSEYQSSLINIIRETERLNQIINSLMELVQTDIANYEFHNISMDELLWEIIDELSEENIDIQYNLLANRTKYTLQGNRQLLFIGINNIIKNAIKFSGKQKVYCALFCDEHGVNITIRDEGIGIGPKDMSRIFQPFYRAPNALNYSGYGIGLSLTHNIVKLHNGTINVTSTLHKGTTFHVIFPH